MYEIGHGEFEYGVKFYTGSSDRFCACALKVAKMVQNSAKLAKIKVLCKTGDRELNFALNISGRSTIVTVSAHAQQQIRQTADAKTRSICYFTYKRKLVT